MFDRKIIGFLQDEQNDWVAELECGHTRHMRHNPPWVTRPWVVTSEGRQSHLGMTVVCKKCESERAAGAQARHDG
jgi:Protein of unknown function (DUF3565)